MGCGERAIRTSARRRRMRPRSPGACATTASTACRCPGARPRGRTTHWRREAAPGVVRRAVAKTQHMHVRGDRRSGAAGVRDERDDRGRGEEALSLRALRIGRFVLVPLGFLATSSAVSRRPSGFCAASRRVPGATTHGFIPESPAVAPSVAEKLRRRAHSARHSWGFLSHGACSSGSPYVKLNHRFKLPGIGEIGTAPLAI